MRCLPVLLCLLPMLAQAEISVVTSIRPLYQITASLMQGAGKPELLIKNQQSAHHLAFRPSHFKTLQQADLVIWIDRRFESGFQSLVPILPEQARQLELLPALGLEKQDGHIWYSPTLLIQISQQITKVLGEIDVDNRHIYDKNRQDFQQNVAIWQQSIEQLLSRHTPRYLLDHDFLHHFEQAFGLDAIAVIYNSHGQYGSIKTLRMIEQRLQTQPANCLISNEADISRIGDNLTIRFNLSRYSIKSFAHDSDAATQFIRHLQHLGEILRDC